MNPLLLALTAAAQTPSEEITVYGTPAVEAARQVVVDELKSLGFTRVKEKDGALVLKHETTWKGKIVLYDDGYLKHRRQGVRVVEGPAKELPKGTRWLPCVVVPTACVNAGFTVADRKLDAVRDRTMSDLAPELQALGDRIADAAVAQTVDSLPSKLEALWERGSPLLVQGPPLATPEARKAELLEFWETRTDTEWGEQVRAVVESFARGVVQTSDHPFTPEELQAFNARSRAGRPLKL